MDDSMKQGIDREAVYSMLYEKELNNSELIQSYLKVMNDLVEMVSTFEDIDFGWMVAQYSLMEEELLSLIQRYTKVVAKKLNETKVVTL